MLRALIRARVLQITLSPEFTIRCEHSCFVSFTDPESRLVDLNAFLLDQVSRLSSSHCDVNVGELRAFYKPWSPNFKLL
jgi:hypothetical protein